MLNVETITATAERILADGPDPVVRLRLLRDVLRRPADSNEVMQARSDLAANPWVRLLESEQRSDGGWGRFHSRDTRSKCKIITTEAGVDRALALLRTRWDLP